MNFQRKNIKNIYKQIEYHYSIYGQNKNYGDNATITVHSGRYTDEICLELDTSFPSLGEAEKSIIQIIKKKIDTIVN